MTRATASAVSFRDCPPFVPHRHPVGRQAPGLTRTELCHRAALCYEAVIQRARENMRRAATYAHYGGGGGLIDQEIFTRGVEIPAGIRYRSLNLFCNSFIIDTIADILDSRTLLANSSK